jgi:hypothetical protein
MDVAKVRRIVSFWLVRDFLGIGSGPGERCPSADLYLPVEQLIRDSLCTFDE